jgi:PilZ domain
VKDSAKTNEPSKTSAETRSNETSRAEQRRHHRLSTDLNVQVSWIDGYGFENETAAVVKNISAGGFGVELDQKRPVGSRLTVRTATHSLACVVRHAQPIRDIHDVLYVGLEILPAPDDAKRAQSLGRLGAALSNAEKASREATSDDE